MPVLIMALSGEYDIHTSRTQLAMLLRSCVAEPSVALDFERVTYMDSTALTELVRFQQERERRRLGPAVLVNLSPAISRLLRLSGLYNVWPVYESLDAVYDSDVPTVIARNVRGPARKT